MNKKTLLLLQKVREHELEREEISLREKSKEESNQRIKAKHSLSQALKVQNQKSEISSLATLMHADEAALLFHGKNLQEMRQLSIFQQAKSEQVKQTLNAKKNHDMIEKLIGHLEKGEMKERELLEIKLLDEFSGRMKK